MSTSFEHSYTDPLTKVMRLTVVGNPPFLCGLGRKNTFLVVIMSVDFTDAVKKLDPSSRLPIPWPEGDVLAVGIALSETRASGHPQ